MIAQPQARRTRSKRLGKTRQTIPMEGLEVGNLIMSGCQMELGTNLSSAT